MCINGNCLNVENKLSWNCVTNRNFKNLDVKGDHCLWKYIPPKSLLKHYKSVETKQAISAQNKLRSWNCVTEKKNVKN